jgi:hypothetical protein
MLAVIGLGVAALVHGCSVVEDTDTSYRAHKVEDLGSPLIRFVHVDSGQVWVGMPRGSGAAEAQQVWCTLLLPNGLEERTTALNGSGKKWPQPVDCDVYGSPSAAGSD